MAKRIGLIVGGINSEREISLKTGESFRQAVESLGYEFAVIDAKEDFPQQLAQTKPDVALLAVHGKLAEDGTIQGICEYMKIPYSGSGILATSMAFDKIMAKEVLDQKGVQSAPYAVFDAQSDKVSDFKPPFEFPLVVKPSRDGSSVGVSICKKSEEFQPALELAAKYDRKVLIEDYIPGKEIAVTIFRNQAMAPIEIRPKSGYYDYKNKYTAGNTEYLIPAEVSSEVAESLKELALKSFETLGCRAYARVDFRLTEKNEPFLLEVNTLPGATETSLVPMSCQHAGISFESFIRELIESASLDYEGVS